MRGKLVLLFMLVIAFNVDAYEKFRDLYPQQPRYLKRSGGAWGKMGRIVGVLKHPPEELTITFYSIATGKNAYVYKAPGQLNIYKSTFLAPGTYRVTIKSPGFHSVTVKKVKVKAHYDCFLDIVFGLHVYTNN